MEFEGNREEIPLEDKTEWEEDEEGYWLDTSFGGREPFFDDPAEEPQSLVFNP